MISLVSICLPLIALSLKLDEYPPTVIELTEQEAADIAEAAMQLSKSEGTFTRTTFLNDPFFNSCSFDGSNHDFDWVCDTLGCGGSSHCAEYDNFVSC